MDVDINIRAEIDIVYYIEQNEIVAVFHDVVTILDFELDPKLPSSPIAYEEDKPIRVVINLDIVPVAGTIILGSDLKRIVVKINKDVAVSNDPLERTLLKV